MGRYEIATEVKINVLEADPDLASGLSREAVEDARGHANAPVLSLAPGPWTVGDLGPGEDIQVQLILDGFLVRKVEIGTAGSCAELLGPGDVFDQALSDQSVPGAVIVQETCSVVKGTTLAGLDRRFFAAMGPWPEIERALIGRALRRAGYLGFVLALSGVSPLSDRLLMLLWHLADRFGAVTPKGRTVPIGLTHDLLATLLCVKRPSVSTAFKILERGGVVIRSPDKTLLLVRHLPP